MKKSFLKVFLSGMMVTSLVVGCGQSNTINESASSKFERLDFDLNVGMVTDSGSIDDRSFNQGTWEGVAAAVKNARYIQPKQTSEADFLTAISNLYDAGYSFIVTPGFTFEGAIYEAQTRYPDAQFLLIDGIPTNKEGQSYIAENTTCISFAEHEAGFLAGVAAAVELQEGDFAFLGGMEVPAVQKLNWGFQQGVVYANENLGTQIHLKEENIIYQGTFTDMAAGQQIASQFLDRGVDVIFVAAGTTGVGAITEVKSRAAKGEAVWTIGVDVDQYEEGIYAEGKSVMLTSAMKYLDQAAYTTIKEFTEGKFNGGKSRVFSVENNGVGIPAENPNLSEATMQTVEQVRTLIAEGKIVVDGTNSQGKWGA